VVLPTSVGRDELGLAAQLRLGRTGRAGRTVAAGELLDTASRVDELLLTGEVRVAGRADADLDVLAGGAGLVGSSAGADDRGVVVVGMKTSFHKSLLLWAKEIC